MTTHQLDTGIGVSAVADDVAKAPQLLGVAAGHGLEHGFESLQVGVDVRGDRDLHPAKPLPGIRPWLARRKGVQACGSALLTGATSRHYSSDSPASAPPYSGRFLMPSRVRHFE